MGSEAAGSLEGEAPRRRRRTREQARTALVDAAHRLLERREPLTTVAVTKRAGMAQPNFYSHFKNIDELEALVIGQVADELRERHRAWRVRRHQKSPTDFALLIDEFDRMLQSMIDAPTVLKVVDQYRSAPAPHGEVIRSILEQACSEVSLDLWELAKRCGARSENRPDFDILARFQVNEPIRAALALLVGELRDRRRVARMLAIRSSSSFDGAVRLAGGDPGRLFADD